MEGNPWTYQIIFVLLLIGETIGGGGADSDDKGSASCSQKGSFLGVGNSKCIKENLSTAAFLITTIIVISLLLESLIEYVLNSVRCPQMRKIVNRLFEELMTMGFISMVIFITNTAGLIKKISESDADLDAVQALHFQEFFHYVIFLTMVYYILLVLMLLFIGTVVPRLLWYRKKLDDADEEEYDDIEIDCEAHSRQRQLSGLDLVSATTAYELLKKRYEREGWCFNFRIAKQFSLWKSFELLAFNICRYRSQPIYSNAKEMNRIFGVNSTVDYRKYNVLCMRNLLSNIMHMHWSSFAILILVVFITALFPDNEVYIFTAVGVALLCLSILIMLKTSKILKGIVDDRLNVITNKQIEYLAPLSVKSSKNEAPFSTQIDMSKKTSKITFKSLALAVRAIIRLQMSALCHNALHSHEKLFWFSNPMFLLRLFQLSTLGQAFYLVWFTLVEIEVVISHNYNWLFIIVMIFLPLVSLFIITPLTMPSLVLVMSLTGFFVDQNSYSSKGGNIIGRLISKKARQERVESTRSTISSSRDHNRRVRRSYLRNSHHDLEERNSKIGVMSPPSNDRKDNILSPGTDSDSQAGRRKSLYVQSPGSDVFLRMYDLPSPDGNINPESEGKCHTTKSTPRSRQFSFDHTGRVGSDSWFEEVETPRSINATVNSHEFGKEAYGSRSPNPALENGVWSQALPALPYTNESISLEEGTGMGQDSMTSKTVPVLKEGDSLAGNAALNLANFCNSYGGYAEKAP